MSNELATQDPYIGKMTSLRDVKKSLLSTYRQERKGIIQQLEVTPTGFSTDQLLNLIIEDMLNSTEDLQGATLMLENDGDLKNASAITIKRADLLKLVAEVATRKKELSQRSGEIDLNSPAFCIFQKLCFDKMVESMEELKIETEMINLLLTRWQTKMKDWGKELKRALKEIED